MDSHEKLSKLLSQYLSSGNQDNQIPSEIIEAYHKLDLTEYASRTNVDEMYEKKIDELQADLKTSTSSRFANDYAAQQKQEIDAAYKLICIWLSEKNKA